MRGLFNTTISRSESQSIRNSFLTMAAKARKRSIFAAISGVSFLGSVAGIIRDSDFGESQEDNLPNDGSLNVFPKMRLFSRFRGIVQNPRALIGENSIFILYHRRIPKRPSPGRSLLVRLPIGSVEGSLFSDVPDQNAALQQGF